MHCIENQSLFPEKQADQRQTRVGFLLFDPSLLSKTNIDSSSLSLFFFDRKLETFFTFSLFWRENLGIKEMAIQAQLSYNAAPNANQIGFPLIGSGGGGSEFSLVNNNGGIGLGIDHSFSDNNLQPQKDFNQQTLFHVFHPQQNRSQSFLDVHMEKQRQEIDQFIRLQVRHHIISTKDSVFKTWGHEH